MSTVLQLEEGNFNNGLPPPLRELFLEIQVNKLIQEYLFSSNADDRCTSLRECRETKAAFTQPNQFHAADTTLLSAGDAPCVMPTEASDNHPNQSPHGAYNLYRSASAVNGFHMQTAHESLTLHSLVSMQDKGSNGVAADTAHEASVATLCMESAGKPMNKTANLSRVDTFPCTSKVQLQLGMPSKGNTEIKVSCKKPPRPPRLPKTELSASLKRCCSDNGAYMQSLRRAKLERKRKATATSGVNTSIWALLFTFCFAIIMIAQGFWSQGSQNFTSYGNDASSPMEPFMRASTKGSREEPRLAQSADGEVRTERIPAQSYMMRKVQLQYLSDMKPSERDAFPKS